MKIKNRNCYLGVVVLLGLGIFLFCKKGEGTKNGNNVVDKKTKNTNKSSLTRNRVKTKSKTIKKMEMVRFKDFPNEDIKCYPNKLRVNYSHNKCAIYDKEYDDFYCTSKTLCDLKGKKESIEIMCKKYNCKIESKNKNEFILVFKDKNDPSEVAKLIDYFNILGRNRFNRRTSNQTTSLICNKDLNKHNIRYLTYVGNVLPPTYKERQTKYPDYIHPKKSERKSCSQFVTNLLKFKMFGQNGFKRRNKHLTLKDKNEKCHKNYVYELCKKLRCRVIGVNNEKFMVEFNDIPKKIKADDALIEIKNRKELILKYQRDNNLLCGRAGFVRADRSTCRGTPTSISRETNDNYKSYNVETAYCTYERTKYNDAFLILRYFKSQGWLTMNNAYNPDFYSVNLINFLTTLILY
jgi:hypothetical protein